MSDDRSEQGAKTPDALKSSPSGGGDTRRSRGVVTKRLRPFLERLLDGAHHLIQRGVDAGHGLQEAGATPVQEIAYAMSTAIA
ncbi:hypothetical protein, partial [Streptomyces sp. NPDC052015]|uniref:hypothetical protein n=1 Tax=Streptomyces sp. NPDC052015 TaxID=3154755 RepID=UPI00341D4DDD